MTAAAVVFCCVLALGYVEGFATPAFVGALASDAIGAAMPLLGVLLVARYVAQRYPARAAAAAHAHAAAQGLLVSMSFAWWWIEPHAMLTKWSNGSLSSMGWAAVAGTGLGYALSHAAERTRSPVVAREVLLGSWALFLLGGGRAYRAFDDVASGARVEALALVAASVALVAIGSYFLLRGRERVAAAIPALAPLLACLALFGVARPAAPAAPSQAESVLLVVVDTLRADVADGGLAGVGRVMPELERIAALGTRFTQAVAPSPWTLPSTVSLLGGWNPHRHGYGASASGAEVLGGDPRALHLARTMRDAGYLTAAFVNNPWLRPFYGFDDGFLAMRPYHGRALDGVALLMSWLQDHASAPSFTVLHLMDPHWPYEAPPGFGPARADCEGCDSLFTTKFVPTTTTFHDEVRRRYAAEAAYTDAVLGQLHDSLDAAGALERTWLVVTSDHGEELWEHGAFLHGHELHDELLRVPLVVVPPKSRKDAARGVRVGVQVGLEDVAATILEIAGRDAALAPDGRSLLPALAGGPAAAGRTVVAGFVKSPDDLRYAVRTPRWKSVVSRAEMAGNRLFDLWTDAGEEKSLLFDGSLNEARRREASMAWAVLVREPARLGLDVARRPAAASGLVPEADTHGRLRSLGYAE